MRHPRARVISWSMRLLSIVIALWWPALWRDPIYTPRQVRLGGLALRLPDGVEPALDDDRALAIFWMWEHRALVKTRWVIGPYRGLRQPEGRRQTLLVMAVVWGVSSGVLFLGNRPAPADARRRRRRGAIALLTTPFWQLLLSRSRRDDLTS
jgi:hypothetical protein